METHQHQLVHGVFEQDGEVAGGLGAADDGPAQGEGGQLFRGHAVHAGQAGATQAGAGHFGQAQAAELVGTVGLDRADAHQDGGGHAGAELVRLVHAETQVHGTGDGLHAFAELVEELGAGLLDGDGGIGEHSVVDRAHAFAVEELGEDALDLLVAGGDAGDGGDFGGCLDLGHVGGLGLGGGGRGARRGCLVGHRMVSRVGPGGRVWVGGGGGGVADQGGGDGLGHAVALGGGDAVLGGGGDGAWLGDLVHQTEGHGLGGGVIVVLAVGQQGEGVLGGDLAAGVAGCHGLGVGVEGVCHGAHVHRVAHGRAPGGVDHEDGVVCHGDGIPCHGDQAGAGGGYPVDHHVGGPGVALDGVVNGQGVCDYPAVGVDADGQVSRA